jgi:hypothetical protein
MTFKELFSDFISMTPIKRKSWRGYWKFDPRTNSVNMFTKEGNVVNFRDNQCEWAFTLSNILQDDWEVATNENCDIPVG